MAEPEVLTAAQLAERMGITPEQLIAQAQRSESSVGPNRSQRRQMARAGRRKGR